MPCDGPGRAADIISYIYIHTYSCLPVSVRGEGCKVARLVSSPFHPRIYCGVHSTYNQLQLPVICHPASPSASQPSPYGSSPPSRGSPAMDKRRGCRKIQHPTFTAKPCTATHRIAGRKSARMALKDWQGWQTCNLQCSVGCGCAAINYLPVLFTVF